MSSSYIIANKPKLLIFMEKSYLNCVLMALNKGNIEVSVVIPTLNEEQNIKKTRKNMD